MPLKLQIGVPKNSYTSPSAEDIPGPSLETHLQDPQLPCHSSLKSIYYYYLVASGLNWHAGSSLQCAESSVVVRAL